MSVCAPVPLLLQPQAITDMLSVSRFPFSGHSAWMKSDPLWFFLAESFVWHNLFEVYSSAFLLVNSILFMNVSHFIYQSPVMNIWIISRFGLLWKVVLLTFAYISLCGDMLSFLQWAFTASIAARVQASSCDQHCTKHFICIFSFNPQNNALC